MKASFPLFLSVFKFELRFASLLRYDGFWIGIVGLRSVVLFPCTQEFLCLQYVDLLG